MSDPKPARHILSMSGGKDSTALALYMKDRIPEMEYVFMDTGKELPETYDYLRKIEAFLGKKIVMLNSDRDFDHWLQVYSGFLPSPRTRWCTRQLKIIPFEKYVGDELVHSYIGIRADEDRDGYISSKPNIIPHCPFKEDGLVHADILRILENSGLGLPPYYSWRTRSGCTFCFFQRKIEWVGLKEHHPDKFEEAMRYEKVDPATGQMYTWSQGETLSQLAERSDEIRRNHEKSMKRLTKEKQGQTLFEIFREVLDDESGDESPCLVCDV
ncbi:MAG TPA: phosphoadenosine phosphosulfate reductase family protein [Planctomycetota bacterium]|nr:phosphoadenosine phosphosulfate reductase family protein [Planctomycetota bacterium]